MNERLKATRESVRGCVLEGCLPMILGPAICIYATAVLVSLANATGSEVLPQYSDAATAIAVIGTVIVGVMGFEIFRRGARSFAGTSDDKVGK